MGGGKPSPPQSVRRASTSVGQTEIVKTATFSERCLVDEEGNVNLIPQPSPDLADPLNWSPLQKWAIVVLLIIWSATALSVQSFLNNYEPTLETMFPDQSLSNINLLLTLITPMIAPGQLIFTTLAIARGRRFSLLLSIVVLIASTVWGACATSYSSLLGSRVVQGLAGGPTDALCFTVVQEFTFMHERGKVLGAIMMGQLGLQLVFAIVTNYMAVTVGFKWPFVMFACISGATLIGLYLVMPDTRYDRTDNSPDHVVTVEDYPEFRKLLIECGGDNSRAHRLCPTLDSRMDWRAVGYFWKTIAESLRSPVIWWISCICAASTGTLIASSTMYASMLVSPPWSWSSTNVGLINIGPTLITLLNWAIMGWGSDKVLLYLAKRNGGMSDPKHRLLLLTVPVLVGVAANLGFGGLAERYFIHPDESQPHWFSLVVVLSMYYMMFGGILEVTFTYLANRTDPEKSLAAMTCVAVIRDLASFGMSYGVTSFSQNCGYLTSYGVYALLIGAFGLMTVPVYLFT